MNLIILGAPGAGKGTQSAFISARHHIPQISTGDMLRAQRRAGTPFGNQVKAAMDSGALVPDDVMIEVVRQRLSEPDASRGFILDGFPRTVGQAQALDAMLKEMGRSIDSVLYLTVSSEALIQRLSNRYSCRTCDAVYTFTPDQARNLPRCSRDGGELYQREDDRPQVVTHRIDVFLDQTAPVIDFYRAQGKLETINGEGTVEQVRDQIAARLAADQGARSR